MCKQDFLPLCTSHRPPTEGTIPFFKMRKAQFNETSNTMRELSPSMLPTLAGKDVLALVDADGPQWAPTRQVCHSRVRIVVVSSPNDEKSRGWMKQIPGGILATAYMINHILQRRFS